jgi:tRNA(fMet)-specific endonuclease VapC
MAGRYLLDTSVVIPLFRGEDPIQRRFDAAESIFLSSIVLGELHFGAEGSSRPAEQTEQIESLASLCRPLRCDGETARYYGRIKQDLRRRGRPIPENDLWIAATALQYGLVLVTRDAHFDEIKGLTTEHW